MDLIQTFCGFDVPFFEHKGESDIHFKWAQQKGEEGLKAYIQE